jgi:hypothetical protein
MIGKAIDGLMGNSGQYSQAMQQQAQLQAQATQQQAQLQAQAMQQAQVAQQIHAAQAAQQAQLQAAQATPNNEGRSTQSWPEQTPQPQQAQSPPSDDLMVEARKVDELQAKLDALIKSGVMPDAPEALVLKQEIENKKAYCMYRMQAVQQQQAEYWAMARQMQNFTHDQTMGGIAGLSATNRYTYGYRDPYSYW